MIIVNHLNSAFHALALCKKSGSDDLFLASKFPRICSNLGCIQTGSCIQNIVPSLLKLNKISYVLTTPMTEVELKDLLSH